MENTPPPTEHDDAVAADYAAIAEKVRTGEYFNEARSMYDTAINDPMAERYFYVGITIMALATMILALIAVQGLYPLQTPIPFIVSSTNIVEDIPHIHTLLTNKDDNPSDALLGFLVQNYIGLAEDYDIDTFDRNISGVKSQSSESVFKQFHASVEQRNPQSPVNLYQRHSTRKINVLKMNKLSESSMQVIYEALVESKDDVKKSHWEANISFSYSGIALDEKTGRAKPVSFTVTQYRTKRLQDEK